MNLASKELCTGCKACEAICFNGAVQFVPDEEGFARPQIDNDRCIGCGLCEKICPVLHLGMEDLNPKCYIARSKDVALRLQCSSGGISELLAKEIIKEGGSVFGCVMEPETMAAIHRKVGALSELSSLRGSKYVQSDLRNVLKEVKDELDNGRRVMFIGTPCQVAGLKAYLRQPYDSLVTVTFLCHGVPSPDVLREYIRQVESQAKSKVRSIHFRNKSCSWRRFSLLLEFSNDVSRRLESKAFNPYLRAFLSDLCLRPSCYHCSHKGGREGADITLADCWGIEKIAPDFNDDIGISLVLLHSMRGFRLFEQIKGLIDSRAVTYQQMLESNRAYVDCPVLPRARRRFMASFRCQPMKGLVDFLVEGPWWRRQSKRVWHKGRSFCGKKLRDWGLKK